MGTCHSSRVERERGGCTVFKITPQKIIAESKVRWPSDKIYLFRHRHEATEIQGSVTMKIRSEPTTFLYAKFLSFLIQLCKVLDNYSWHNFKDNLCLKR